jgi:hypothetical protein
MRTDGQVLDNACQSYEYAVTVVPERVALQH